MSETSPLYDTGDVLTLREGYTGLVITQAVIQPASRRLRSGSQWLQVRGTVIVPGKTRFAVGQHISWPYDPQDWEELAEPHEP